MLTITKLRGAEYLISSVAGGLEDYYMGAGEAPGVWRGRWAAALGLEGVVGADELRALVNGHDPNSGVDLLVGHRERTVRAIDVTLSVPKSVSLLWAFGSPEVASVVSIAVVEATDIAVGFLEERVAYARQQHGGVRRRVATGGFAVATFAHRTSRAGDPQLHTHCLIPNLVRRADGRCVAFDANPLHTWGKAAGTVFLNELERILTQRLGVAWGSERNGCREMVGFTREQLRAFSKRTVAIETHLEAADETVFESKRERMRADDRASLLTRQPKDKTLTPARLRDRWNAETVTVGLQPGVGVDDLVVGRDLTARREFDDAEVFAALVDPTTGLCATQSRFGEAHVVERVAALSGGRLSVEEIVTVSQRFLASDLIVRLAPGVDRRRPPEWSTVEHRAVEDRLLGCLHVLVASPGETIDPLVVDVAIAAEPKPLGDDQAGAVRTLCGDGTAVRVLVAPAGFGKTTALHAAAAAQLDAGRSVVALAPTHKAVGELRVGGLDAQTIARFVARLEDEAIPDNTTLIIDEISQVGTRDAAIIVDAVARTRGAQLWCVGDAHQGQSIAAGGLVIELERLADQEVIPTATLTRNRRQQDPADQRALALLRAGAVDASRAIRTAWGWEHELASPVETRQALAHAAVADTDRYGVDQVAALAVSHADCEDLTDRIRAIRARRGELRGPTLVGPGWGPTPRVYAAGDRVLVHANLGAGPDLRVCNGSTGTVLGVDAHGADVLLDDDHPTFLPAAIIGGCRPDGTPNVSHAWARTVDGAQGGTWHQVHLLGTPALDRFSGYVGQSRGQRPTHTWHTRPATDHPARLLADRRLASDVVADAMRRAEPKAFAAYDEPWPLDRQLHAERDEHVGVVATRPPARHGDLERVRDALRHADDEQHWATQGVAHYEAERARLGPLTRLRRGGRDDITRAENALAGAHRRLARATAARHDAHAELARYEAGVAEREAWDQAHAWRLPRIAEIDTSLAHHWADVTLRAVRADDPLAFGIERLRAANTTYRADREHILRGLPDDRRDALARAQTDLHDRKNNLRDAEAAALHARTALDHANQRHRGRRDKPSIARATAALSGAETNLARACDALTRSRERVGEEQQTVDRRTAAMKTTHDQRTRLIDAIRNIDQALDLTRPERVAAATTDPTSTLWDTLGPPPTTRGGLAAWCGIAEHLETHTDRTHGSDHWTDCLAGTRTHATRVTRPRGLARNGRDELAKLLDHAQDIIAAASKLDPTPACHALDNHCTWQPAVEAARQTIVAEQSAPVIEHGLGLGL